MNIILFGPPGAGKGTQGDNLVKKFNLYRISTGDLLRDVIKNKKPLYKKISLIINKGELVPDDIINDLIFESLTNKNIFNKIIFDGYPRNIIQAKNLDIILNKFEQKITYVFNLKVDQDIITKRILGRQICNKCGLIFNKYFKPSTLQNHSCDKKYLTKRVDDNEDTIRHRFNIYKNETLPILNYYNKRSLLHEIDGNDDFTSIFKQISDIINSLEG